MQNKFLQNKWPPKLIDWKLQGRFIKYVPTSLLGLLIISVTIYCLKDFFQMLNHKIWASYFEVDRSLDIAIPASFP